MWFLCFGFRIFEGEQLHGVYLMQPDANYVGMWFPGHDHVDHLGIDEPALRQIDLKTVSAELRDLPLGSTITMAQPSAFRLAERIAQDRRHALVLREKMVNFVDFERHADRKVMELKPCPECGAALKYERSAIPPGERSFTAGENERFPQMAQVRGWFCTAGCGHYEADE